MGTEEMPERAGVEPAQERFSFKPFVEMGNDLRRRRPHYLSDWTDGFHRKVLSSSLFTEDSGGPLRGYSRDKGLWSTLMPVLLELKLEPSSELFSFVSEPIS